MSDIVITVSSQELNNNPVIQLNKAKFNVLYPCNRNNSLTNNIRNNYIDKNSQKKLFDIQMEIYIKSKQRAFKYVPNASNS